MSARPDQDKTCDVLIVGFGPVGASIAALLGGYGVRTIVVEREKSIVMAPRAITLDNEALRILQMVGLRRNAFQKVTIPRVRMVCPHFPGNCSVGACSCGPSASHSVRVCRCARNQCFMPGEGCVD
jgi:ribulose 1,5-bisphosphate synthetase/thiazole synthase